MKRIFVSLFLLLPSGSAVAACEFRWSTHNGYGYVCDARSEAAELISTLPDGDDQRCRARWAGGWLGSGTTIYFDHARILESVNGYFYKEVTCSSTNGRSRSDLYQHQIYYGSPEDGFPIGHVGLGKNNEICPVGDNGSNPIQSALGHKIQKEEDFPISGGFSFTRTYSSRNEHRGSSFGRRWNHDFDISVQPIHADDDGLIGAFARRANGDLILFNINEQSVAPSDPDVVIRLEAEWDEDGELLGWVVVNENDGLEIYAPDGYLSYLEAKDGKILHFGYSEFKRLNSISDRKGRAVNIEHDALGRVNRIVSQSGEAYRYTYDSDSRLVRVTYPSQDDSGPFKEYLYENSQFPDLLTGLVDEQGTRYVTWAYDEQGRGILSVYGDEQGEVGRVSLSYIQDGATRVTNPYGQERDFTFVTQHGAVKLEGLSLRADGCGGNGSLRSYDANGFLESMVDFRGYVTEYDHDASGREGGRTEAVGTDVQRNVGTDWHNEFRVPIERRIYDASASLVVRTNWTYNTRGQALSETRTDPAKSISRTTTTTYCEEADVTAGLCPLVGLVTSVEGAHTDVNDLTTYTYYPGDHPDCAAAPTTCPYRKGDLWKIVNASGQVTETLRYDGAGRPLSVKDANGVITDFEYHPRGWLTGRKVRGPDDNTETDDRITRIDYWPTGLVRRVTQPDGAYTEYDYDAAHRLTIIRDNAGNSITYTLDNAGNRIAEETRDAAGMLRQTLSRVFNQLGQLATQADASANPTDYTYDANGNLKSITDALGRETVNDYDPLNRLVRTLQDVDGIEAETGFEYDALDHLTKVVDPNGLETTYTYNAFGDLLQLDSPDSGITTYTYDSAGNRTGQVDARGQGSTYAYDALNRLTAIAYDGAPELDVGYVYDVVQPGCDPRETFAVGRLTAMSDASGSTRYCYDRFGELVRKIQVTNGQTFALRYAYTKGGRLNQLTYPDGSVADYVRDAQGRITEIGVTSPGGSREVLVTDATHYPFGPAAGWAYGNGRTLGRTHDLDYRSQSILDSATGGLDVGYSYDPAGNLTALHTGDLAAPPRASFDYDALGRLTAFRDGATGDPIESYGYDATGNRTSFANSGGSQAYAYPADSHRLESVAGRLRVYDAAGNTTRRDVLGGRYLYHHDAAGRLGSAAFETQGVGVNPPRPPMVMPLGLTATVTRYVYNGKGERMRRFRGMEDVNTVYDEAGRWLGDYDVAGTPIQQAIWLDDYPVGLLVGASGINRLHYVQPDHLGTPRAVIDPVRNVAVWTWDLASEAFGNSPPNEDPDNDGTSFVFDMRFPGQRYDAASGLNYNYFRDYEPGTGRYSQSDPIGLGGGVSTYGYVGGDPLAFIDPLGQEPNRRCVNRFIAFGATCGGAIGYIGGGVGGALGGGAACTLVAPGVGTAGCGAAGAIGGSKGGGLLGAGIGGTIGGILGQALCPEDDEDECENLLATDTATCNAITRMRSSVAGARCHASASQRYAACLRGDPIPPLDTWNN